MHISQHVNAWGLKHMLKHMLNHMSLVLALCLLLREWKPSLLVMSVSKVMGWEHREQYFLGMAILQLEKWPQAFLRATCFLNNDTIRLSLDIVPLNYTGLFLFLERVLLTQGPKHILNLILLPQPLMSCATMPGGPIPLETLVSVKA